MFPITSADGLGCAKERQCNVAVAAVPAHGRAGDNGVRLHFRGIQIEERCVGRVMKNSDPQERFFFPFKETSDFQG